MSPFLKFSYVAQDWCTQMFAHAHVCLGKCMDVAFLPQAHTSARIRVSKTAFLIITHIMDNHV